MMRSVELYVATHKKIELHLPDYCKFVQVNALKNGRWAGYLHDNDHEDNISEKNNSYCELTALYALWKNSDADIKGLFHYRRYLSNMTKVKLSYESNRYRDGGSLCKSIITKDNIFELLSKYDVIIPLDNCPFPLTAYEDLQRFVYVEDINKMTGAFRRCFPEYEEDLWSVLRSTNISYCNMFIGKREFVNAYCEWLFNVLGEIEKGINISSYDASHQRIFGYFAEVLMHVYLRHNHYTTAKVYRIDLLEKKGFSVFLYKGKQAMNRMLANCGIYPIKPYRPLWKARFRWLTEKRFKGEIQNAWRHNVTTELLCNLYASIGGEGIVTNKETNYDSVTGIFGNVKLVTFICRTSQGIVDILNIVQKQRQETVAFGKAVVYRLVPHISIDPMTLRQFERFGISVATEDGH